MKKVMSSLRSSGVTGAGLGFRREFLSDLENEVSPVIDFFEVSLENWMDVDGRLGMIFRDFTERYTFVAHGLSLSLGGSAPLDVDFLRRMKNFLDQHQFAFYTEHLSFCSDEGHLYDLYSIPFTEESVQYVANRIRLAQDILERPIAIENAAYYVKPPLADMNELTFINAVLEEADCVFHLDVNNVYVNSINHGYDPYLFLQGLPGARIVYGHIAGHETDSSGALVDTHGQKVIDPVWKLLALAYESFGVFPTLLERDLNIPPLAELLTEVEQIAALQDFYNRDLIGGLLKTDNGGYAAELKLRFQAAQ